MSRARQRFFRGLLLLCGLFLIAVDARPSPSTEAVAGCRTEAPALKQNRISAADHVTLASPSNGAYIGLYSIGTISEDRIRFTANSGHRPAIVFTFHDWVSEDDWASPSPHFRTFTDPLESSSVSPLQLAEQVRNEGGVLAVAWAIQCCDWESYLFWYGFRKPTVTVDRLLRGDFDPYITSVARQIKTYGHPIMLTLFSEFNYQGMMGFGEQGETRLDDVNHVCRLYGDPTWPDGPERIRDAFIYVIDRFRKEDVRNVTWFMYAGSHYMNTRHEDYSPWLHPQYFYPGDDYIDWVGQSVYFVDPRAVPKLRQQELATSVSEALAPGYAAWGAVTDRPLFLPEFGVLGDKTRSRARVIEEVFRDVLPQFPRVRAITLADFKIAEDYYEVPRFGTFEDETRAWRRAVRENPRYLKQASFKGGE
ncbi:MAG: hypothetical protein OJF47_000445 [Nitrospira sp.]|jgi:hypothetical protein|nr:MAG: hypothetical protein OJF47_000445 [Nitrospira sp.]